MEPNSLTWVGSPCGLHGPYVFYKAFKFHLEGKPRILSLGDFFFVRCKPGDPICIAELQLLWEERTTKQLLSSSKLYFLPEDTPQGRTVSHGEDEIVAVSEKVIVKLDNLVTWTARDVSQWRRGLRAAPLKTSVLKELGNNGRREALHKYRESTLNSGLNFRDVLKEKAELGDDEEGKKVLVLSYPQYCRYRSVIARLRETPSSLLTDHVVLALGGIISLNGNTRILYCRETFDHPTLIQNESISEEFAPNLKGRPRKKKPWAPQRRDSQGPNKDPGSLETPVSAKVKAEPKAGVTRPKSSGSGCKKAPAEEADQARPAKGEGEEQAFLVSLYKYMKERGTPIERIPYLGFKQINLWTMFQAAQKLGGYEPITARRQWKNVYDELGGNPGSTSAATCTRRHYERLILPYERHMKGEEDKPLPLMKQRRQEPGVPEDSGVKPTEVKRPKVTLSHKAPGEADTFQKSPKPSPVSGCKEESAEPVEQAKEEMKSHEEDEEELQVTMKEETLCADVVEEETLPSDHCGEDGGTERLPDPTADPRGYSETQTGEIPDDLPTAAAFSPELCRPHAPDGPAAGPDRPATRSDGAADTPTARETDAHVGLVPPTPKPPQPPASSSEDPADEEESCFSYRPVAPPGGNAGIMSPLAKKKLLSQVSGRASAHGYPITLPAAAAPANHNGHYPQAPASRPSVIQHAQSFKALGNRKQEVTSELFQQDPSLPSPTAGPYPGEKCVGHPCHRPSFPSFYSTLPLMSLFRPGERCLSREAAFVPNGEHSPRLSPSVLPDRPGSGYHPPLPEGHPPDDQPTDLSLPKSFPLRLSSRPGQCGHAHPAPPRDSASPLLPASSLDYRPKACRVPPMSVCAPRKPQDTPRPPGQHLTGPGGCGPQGVGGARPVRRSLEELERGPPEKKIRAVTPMHPAPARTPDPDAQDKLGDSFAEGLKFPVRGPLFPPLYPGGPDACDRLGGSPGAGYPPHPLQCLKSQAVVSPLLPPFALHSLMVQRQLLASAAAPHLYPHPGGASYGDLLHHGLLPMSALNPPPAFSASQLPSLHPSTKL